MNLNTLKKFAQGARRTLLSEVTSRLEYLLSHDDAYVRSHNAEITEIRRQLEKKSRDQLIEEVAYTWFNRIVALRYMDLRGYHKVRIVSPQVGQIQPELLFQIKQGRTPPEVASLQSVFDGHLNGTAASDQPDREIYTAALLGICNDYSRTLPFLFRQVDEYMAVLLPTDLLSESSILSAVQGAIGEEDVADVEVIGWLYQFYISEKKDQVFGRPKGEKIKKEDIPAATQLFTPHWIVRYMVENSLGRLWRNNRPGTALAEQMEYYIEGDPEPEYLTIAGPEEITLLDPACGSGHILTYAFDLLYGMYEEAGYSAEEIPSLILINNLYGIDIDTRAAELASFALTMKAREKDRFFFKRGVVPRVVAMEDISVDLRDAGIKMSPQLQEAFGYLTEATNFGSLIPVPAEVQGEIEDILAELDARGDADLFADQAMAQVRSGLRQLGYLARRYHCVVTNPPYMSTSNANPRLKDLVKREYEEGKADLFAAFIVRSERVAMSWGYVGMITQQGWLLQPRAENLRDFVNAAFGVLSLVHLGPGAFETIGGEVVQTCTFVFRSQYHRAREHGPTVFVRLVEYDSDHKAENARDERNYFLVNTDVFSKLPGREFAYWLGDQKLNLFRDHEPVDSVADCLSGLQTGNNELFLRFWYEVSLTNIAFDLRDTIELSSSVDSWIPHPKGGTMRRWYGNMEYVLDWRDQGRRLAEYDGTVILKNKDHYLRPCVNWSHTGSSGFGVRYVPAGSIFNVESPSAFCKDTGNGRLIDGDQQCLIGLLGYLNSPVAGKLLQSLNNTLHFLAGSVAKLPFVPIADQEGVSQMVRRAVSLAKLDWDMRESSWDFERSPLMTDYDCQKAAEAVDKVLSKISYARIDKRSAGSLPDQFKKNSRALISLYEEFASLEEENALLFERLYGFDVDEEAGGHRCGDVTFLMQELDLGARSKGQLVLDKKEVLRQFVSYGVGCIFGRYSIDQDGLIIANAGDDLDTYLSQIPEPTLRPDESGILPITDDNDFADDLPSQWRAFLRAAFGGEHYEENLRFLEDGLGKRLRQYFLKGFYDDHVKRYKKRPIYWLITSPKGTLQALIYLHRYNRDTVNRFLNDYLRPYQQKLEAKRVSAEHVLTGGGSSQSEKTKAQKRIDEIRKALEELSAWERDVVRPLAEKRIELDLDDGVKVNYGKLGAILAKVKGLNA